MNGQSGMKFAPGIQTIFHILLILTFFSGAVFAADWATYRNDMARSGATADEAGPNLFAQWKFTAAHPPKPAWPMPAEELPRMHIDNAFNVAIADGAVFFGSSITNQIHAVETATGDIRWTFYTQGPVRFAPAVHDGKVYAGSDDGYVYCLNAADGALVWKYRPGPSNEKVIGNGRLISLWPVRTSVLVDGGTAYFAAGVFPYEGLFICALNASDGSEVWKNDTIGDRAHELQYGGISPHGYLTASKEILYVPSGRAMPAAFDRKTGEFLFYASTGGKRGGAWTLLTEDKLIAGVDLSGVPDKSVYDPKTGKRQGDAFAWFPGVDMVVTSDVSYVLTLDGIYAIDRNAYANAVTETGKLADKRKQLGKQLTDLREKLKSADDRTKLTLNGQIDKLTQEIGETAANEALLKNSSFLWRYPQKDLRSLILTGNAVFAGGDEFVVGIDAKNGGEIWRSSVDGAAVGLAASDGHLLVSTDTGPVYCFGPAETRGVKEINAKTGDRPFLFGKDIVEQAESILAESGITKGYCLFESGAYWPWAYELALRSELQIVVLESDPKRLAEARAHLDNVDLLGSRIIVEPWDLRDLPDYFANIIVTNNNRLTMRSRDEGLMRVLRPWGGTACYFNSDNSVRTMVRGELEGAGNWTQQYADPANTACSNDELVNGSLGVLWFGEPGPMGMVERHARAQSPVAMNGRMFVEGEELIMAIDAFNGTLLWKRDIPGAVRVKTKADSGNLAVTDDGLYVAAFDKCYRLDPATGETVRIYTMPRASDGSHRRWGYISVIGGILYGSAAAPMNEEYGDSIDRFIRDGKWKPIEEIPKEMRELYTHSRNLYSDPADVYMAAQRSGALYRQMTSFGPGGEFTQKNAITEGIMAADRVFAIDTETGDVLWKYDRGEIANVTIVLGDGKIFFADSAVSKTVRDAALKERRRLIESGVYKERERILEELQEKRAMLAGMAPNPEPLSERELTYLIESLEAELYQEENPEGKLTYDDADVRIVTALDAKTGEQLWRTPVDLTGCGGDRMGAAYSGGMLFFFGNHGNHDAWRFRVGGMQWRRITSLSGDSGEMVWSRPLNYRTRPVIVGGKIILEPRACDVRTGDTIMREHPITGEQVPWEFLRPGHTCGISAASADGLFYRSACTAFYDLENDRGVTIFGAYRPGCAISVIPANGLLLSPEASAGCTCSYPVRCSLALKRKWNRPQPWTIFVTPGSLSPAKHFAINLGAAADMKDDGGTVWFAYPNPDTSSHTHFPNYGVKFDLQDRPLSGMGYFSRDFRGVTIDGTDKPWLFTSGCLGLTRCKLPLVDKGTQQEPIAYTVRLGFKAMPGDREGQRVFDIKIQNNLVAGNCDIAQITGSSEKAVVQEFKNVLVESDLLLELVPKTSSPSEDSAPVIHFIEVIREDDGRVSSLPGASGPESKSS